MNIEQLNKANKRIQELESELAKQGQKHKIFMDLEAARINCLVEKNLKLEWQLKNK